MKNVLILGSQSMVGRALINSGVLDGCSIYGITPSPSNIGTGTRGLVEYSPTDFLENTIGKFEKFDFAINLARQRKTINSESGITSLVKYILPRTRCLINASSYAQHYWVQELGKRHEYLQHKREISALLAENKAEVEIFDISFFTICGPLDNPKSFFPSLINAILNGKPLKVTGGEQLISYTDVRDVIQVLTWILLGEKKMSPGVWSFWQSPPRKLHEIIDMTSEILGRQVLLAPKRINYGGHELFEYDSRVFPDQLMPDFPWISFEDSVNYYISSLAE